MTSSAVSSSVAAYLRNRDEIVSYSYICIQHPSEGLGGRGPARFDRHALLDSKSGSCPGEAERQGGISDRLRGQRKSQLGSDERSGEGHGRSQAKPKEAQHQRDDQSARYIAHKRDPAVQHPGL